MSDELDQARDDRAQAEWDRQQATDPHRIRIGGLTPDQRNTYVLFHATQRRIIRQALKDANATRKAFGLPMLPRDPIAAAQLAHHDRMLQRLQALCPPMRPPKPKRRPQPTPAESEAAATARITAYARTHGLSIRQATEALKGTR